MLVLERQLGQEIPVGDDIVVRVIRIRENKVRLGITAPTCLSVDRREVREQKQAKKGQ